MLKECRSLALCTTFFFFGSVTYPILMNFAYAFYSLNGLKITTITIYHVFNYSIETNCLLESQDRSKLSASSRILFCIVCWTELAHLVGLRN